MNLTHDQIIDRLEEIERDLAERQHEFEGAAADRYRLVRDFEFRLAQGTQAAQGSTATERKANALVALATSGDGLYARLMEAEGKYEGLKAAVRVLEQRATIGMSLLKANTREAPQMGQQPAWSGRRAAA